MQKVIFFILSKCTNIWWNSK